MAYDLYIYGQEAWDDLATRGLDVVIDPLVLRTGQLFLEGSPADAELADRRWAAIEEDIGALVAFFDLVVLRRQFPAFNYEDAFDPGPNIGDPLGSLVNSGGDKILFHVDVEHQMYRQAKAAALDELERTINGGGGVTEGVADEIVRTTAAVQYEWSPSLERLEEDLTSVRDKRVGRFLLGQLVFAGYAQQTGAPHVLSPGRSRLAAAVGIGAPKADRGHEADVYDELRRRSLAAGDSWRLRQLPWTPSFLPYLVHQTESKRFRVGPDLLLQQAKDLRETPALERYRTLSRELLSTENENSRDASATLTAAADAVARSLGSQRKELGTLRRLAVDLLPAAAGALGGATVAGPLGAAGGIVVGEAGKAIGKLVVEKVTESARDRLFGWYLDGLTNRSARKLLVRAMRADLDIQGSLAKELRIIWESPRRASQQR